MAVPQQRETGAAHPHRGHCDSGETFDAVNLPTSQFLRWKRRALPRPSGGCKRRCGLQNCVAVVAPRSSGSGREPPPPPSALPSAGAGRRWRPGAPAVEEAARHRPRRGWPRVGPGTCGRRLQQTADAQRPTAAANHQQRPPRLSGDGMRAPGAAAASRLRIPH